MENHPEFHQTVRQATTHKFQTGERKGVGGHRGRGMLGERERKRKKQTNKTKTNDNNKQTSK